MPDLNFEVRGATADDAQALSRLSSSLFPLGCPANTSPEDLAKYIKKELSPERFRALLKDERIVILISKVGDALAGYALVARATAPPSLRSRAQLELRKFYIDSVYHGRGLAQVLMKEVLAIGSEEDEEGRIWLSVFSDNERAISFYTKYGFRIAVGADHQKDYLMLREDVINEEEVS